MFGTEFEQVDVVVPDRGGPGVRINAVRGGEGPPVLLLHGFPQCHHADTLAALQEFLGERA